jgi:hypothetical protein
MRSAAALLRPTSSGDGGWFGFRGAHPRYEKALSLTWIRVTLSGVVACRSAITSSSGSHSFAISTSAVPSRARIGVPDQERAISSSHLRRMTGSVLPTTSKRPLAASWAPMRVSAPSPALFYPGPLDLAGAGSPWSCSRRSSANCASTSSLATWSQYCSFSSTRRCSSSLSSGHSDPARSAVDTQRGTLRRLSARRRLPAPNLLHTAPLDRLDRPDSGTLRAVRCVLLHRSGGKQPRTPLPEQALLHLSTAPGECFLSLSGFHRRWFRYLNLYLLMNRSPGGLCVRGAKNVEAHRLPTGFTVEPADAYAALDTTTMPHQGIGCLKPIHVRTNLRLLAWVKRAR